MYRGTSKETAPIATVVAVVVIAVIVILAFPREEPFADHRDPTADAGPDVKVDQGDIVTFDGSGSSDDRRIINWAWTFEDHGNPVSVPGVTATYTFRHAGVYLVNLTVEDAAGNTDTDDLTVTVRDTEAPVADAGPDVQVPAGTTVPLSGLASSDNVNITGYLWTFQVDGAPVELQGAEASYEFLLVGTYMVTLNVTDAAGNWGVDTTTVVVVDDGEVPVTLTFDFSLGDHGWVPGFADVAPDKVEDVGFEAGIRSLPEYLESTPALWYTGSNFADDLFMFFTTKLEGLAPDTEYDVVFTVGFASMWYVGQPGAGGSPADAVWIRGAMAPEEFRVAPGDQDSLRIFPNVGNMSHDDGVHGIPIGNIGKPDDGTSDWVLLEHKTAPGSFSARTDDGGNLWALFGTDSGFEGINEIYFTHLVIELVPTSA